MIETKAIRQRWLVPSIIVIVVATLIGFIVFLMAPAEERVTNIVLRDPYTPQQVTKESYFTETQEITYRSGSARISAVSGQSECIHYEAWPTVGIAKELIERARKRTVAESSLDQSGQLTASLGECAVSFKQPSGRHELEFQRENVTVIVYPYKGSPLPIGSPEELASLVKTAQTLDDAIARRQAGVSTSVSSHRHCLLVEANFHWYMYKTESLPQYLPDFMR